LQSFPSRARGSNPRLQPDSNLRQRMGSKASLDSLDSRRPGKRSGPAQKTFKCLRG
jgi:hypothetical protein